MVPFERNAARIATMAVRKATTSACEYAAPGDAGSIAAGPWANAPSVFLKFGPPWLLGMNNPFHGTGRRGEGAPQRPEIERYPT